MIADKTLLFTRCATSNASRHFKSPLAMGRDAFKLKHASSVSISEVIDTGVNSNDKTSLTKIKGELIYEQISDTMQIRFCGKFFETGRG